MKVLVATTTHTLMKSKFVTLLLVKNTQLKFSPIINQRRRY